MPARLIVCLYLSPLLISAAAAVDRWPQFRGPGGDGKVLDAEVPIEFGENQALAWKTELPGKAWSSPVIADGTVYLTAAIENLGSDQERERLLATRVEKVTERSSRAIAVAIELKLLMLDLESGSLQRTIDLTTFEQPDAIHTLNSYASPTPVIDGGQIYCHFGNYGTFCVDRGSGELLWQRRIPIVHAVGPGSSPLVYGDLLILIQDGVERQYVMALDKLTGETVWEVDRPPMEAPSGDQKKSYCTPIAVTDAAGREQLICLGSQWIVAYEPTTGNELWRCYHGTGFSVVPRPVCDGDVVYFSTGFGKPHLLAVRIDGSGDVTDSHLEWVVERGIPAKPSPILHQGFIYLIDDNGVASCLRAADGELVWKERIGGQYSASPVLAGGRLYFWSQEGKVTVIRPGPEFQRLAENQIDGQIMASPAIVGKSIVLRTDRAVYRFE